MQAIEIKKLNFSYENIKVFDNLNLNILERKFVTILGKNGSGKSSLVNILSGLLNYNGDILIFGKPLKNEVIRENIVTIFDDFWEYESDDILMDFLINNLGKQKVKDEALNIVSELDLMDYLNIPFDFLPSDKKKLVILKLALLKKPKILILDNLFDKMDEVLRLKLFDELKKLVKEGLTVVNFSNDVKDALYADTVIIIGNGNILLKGSKKQVFEQEEFFEKYDLELPFMVSLSNKLKFYDLINKVYFEEKKLVNDLWK